MKNSKKDKSKELQRPNSKLANALDLSVFNKYSELVKFSIFSMLKCKCETHLLSAPWPSLKNTSIGLHWNMIIL